MAAARMQDPESYNRIFILGARSATEDELRDIFEKYGCVKDVYFVKDRNTCERKDIAYVTFSKASEAALAIEQTNGKPLKDAGRPAKVLLANSRNEGSVRDPNEDAKMLRLFIMVPKSYTEKDIRNDFSQYGEIDYVRFVTDKRTGERRDLAYVKYFRAYHAALALEGCDAHYKPVFASAPRSSREERRGDRDDSYSYGSSTQLLEPRSASRYDKYYDQPEPPMRDPRDILPELVRSYPNPTNETAVEALLSTKVTYEQANRLFDLMPCMEFCNYDQATGIACAKYSTPQAAAYAKDKLDGFEYPPGCRLAIHFYRSHGSSFPNVPKYDSYGAQDVVSNSIQAVRQGMIATAENPSGIKSLIDTIQRAVSVLQQSGQGDVVSSFGLPSFSSSGSAGADGGGGLSGSGSSSTRYCNVQLPDRQPLAPSDSNIVERLFIVATPDAFPASFLEDCFCRFGNMIGAFFMPGKRYGYVKYASSESAHYAVKTMHGQTICGNRMKVMIAEQPPTHGGKRKRENSGGVGAGSYEDFDEEEAGLRSRRMS